MKKPAKPKCTDRATAYARKVVAHEVVAAPLVVAACQRHLSDLENARKLGIAWSPAHAAHAMGFIEGFCRHWKGEWAGSLIELAEPHAFIVGSLFGWFRADGTRRFREAYIQMARKNAKSTLLAAVGLYLLVMDGEPGAEVYSAATKKDQARIVWEDARRMVMASPELRKRLRTFKSTVTIADDEMGSIFRPVASDEDSLDGLNAHGIIIDELHAHKNRGVLERLDTATGARRQPLLVIITTAGDSRSMVCRGERDRSERMQMGQSSEPALFAFIAEPDRKFMETPDGWLDEECWKQANPLYGISVKPDKLRDASESARSTPVKKNSFLRFHLNSWVSDRSAWIDAFQWDQCGGPFSPAELELRMKGRECITGADMASTQDLATFVHVFPPVDAEGNALNGDGSINLDSHWFLIPRFFIPEAAADERERADRVPYREWAKRGRIYLTPGDVVDQEFMLNVLKEDSERFMIRELPFDPWNATQFTLRAEEIGIQPVQFGQSMKNLNEPTKHLLSLVKTAKIVHGGHEVLRWNMLNMAVKSDASGNVRPVKPDAKSSAKIDGAVAAIMGIGRAITVPVQPKLEAFTL